MTINRFKKATDRVCRRITAYLLLGLIVTVTIQVFARQLMRISTPWTEELSKYFLIWATFTGVVSLFIRGEHLIVDILSIHYGPGIRRMARIVNDLIAIAVSGCLLLFGFRLCANPMILDTVTIAMEISRVWMYILLPPSMLLILVFSVLDLYQVFTGTVDEPVAVEGGK